jgi:TatD DNase family protein
MIDTHSHVATNIEGLDFVVMSGSNIEDSKQNVLLAKNNKKILAAVGIHPQEIDNNLNDLEKLITDDVVAVGECGLEFIDNVDKEKQIIYFEKQIELAQKYNKALIVHSREASKETIEILKKYKELRGVIHCYTGGKKRIKEYLSVSENFYFGIDGNLTYEDGLVEVVKNIPKDRLVLETDSPYLTPVPHRFSQNYPEYVKYVYQKVSEIWGLSFEETEKIIDKNAKMLFQII